MGLVKDKTGKCVVEKEPEKPATVVAAEPATAKADAAADKEPEKPRDGLRGFTLSIGGGLGLLGSNIQATTQQNGLKPELYNYHIDNLPALGLQARFGYTYGWKWLRVGFDAGYRFAGATTIVVQLPDRVSLPAAGPGGGPVTSVLHTPRQDLNTTAHDADAAVKFGGYIALPKRLELAIHLRAGLQILGFIPELNRTTPLPQEIYYGPLIGGQIEFQSRFTPGFGIRADGGYIPYAVRFQNNGSANNPGLHDADPYSTTGFYAGGGLSVRVLPGFEVEVTYRLLNMTTNFPQGSVPERLLTDRDPGVKQLAAAGETIQSGSRSTQMQTLSLNLVFFRR